MNEPETAPDAGADVMAVRAATRTTDVVVVISSLAGGGSERVASRLLRTWSDRGLRLRLVTIFDQSFDRYAAPGNVTRTALRPAGRPTLRTSVAGRMLRLLRDMVALRTTIRAADASVALSFLTTTNIKTIVASVGLGVRVVVSERNDIRRERTPWPVSALRWLLYRRADAVTANTRAALRAMERWVPSEKLFFVPNPVRVPPPPPTGAPGRRSF